MDTKQIRTAAGMAVWVAVTVCLLALLWLAGCSQRARAVPQINLSATAHEQFSGEYRAAAIFAPARPAAASATVASLPPMDMFNMRPVWPAPGPTPQGETTYYVECYSDSQLSNASGAGSIYDYTRRSFRFLRFGSLTR